MGHQCDEGITSVGHSAWSFFMSGHSWPKVAEYTNMVDRAATTSSWTALHSMCTPTTATEVSTEASRAWLHEVDARFRGAPCRWARSNGRSPSCCSSWRHKSFQRCKRHFQQVKRRRYRAVAAALPLAVAVHLEEEIVHLRLKVVKSRLGLKDMLRISSKAFTSIRSERWLWYFAVPSSSEVKPPSTFV